MVLLARARGLRDGRAVVSVPSEVQKMIDRLRTPHTGRVPAIDRAATKLLEELAGERDQLRQALAAYRSALRCGEPESDQLRVLGDAALVVSHPGQVEEN